MRAALVVALMCCAPLLARAAPVDVSDLTTRSILVEAPGEAFSIATTYGAKDDGGMPSTTEGELVIAGADYEAYLAAVGDQPGGTVVASSFSDVTIVVDLASLAVDADPITGMVDIGIGPLADLVRTLGTGRTSGFQTVQISPGFFVTIFCDGPTVFGPCTIVPGVSYDTGTGEFTMVGDDTLDHPDITDPRFGKYFASNTFRLTETTAPPILVPALGGRGAIALAATLLGFGLWAGAGVPSRREPASVPSVFSAVCAVTIRASHADPKSHKDAQDWRLAPGGCA
jgi:hypothetical protein